MKQVREQLAGSGIDGVTPVMNVLRDLSRRLYNEWFPTVPPIRAPQLVMTGQAPQRPELNFVVAGYDLNDAGQTADARMYSLAASLDCPMLHDYGFAVNGVAQYALYLLNRLYQPNRSVQELVPLAVYVITETASQDGKVGGPVTVVRVRGHTTDVWRLGRTKWAL